MKPPVIAGIILIVLGAAVLAYGRFSYKKQETILDIGPIKAMAETTKTVPIPPILGWILIAGGVGAMVCGARPKA